MRIVDNAVNCVNVENAVCVSPGSIFTERESHIHMGRGLCCKKHVFILVELIVGQFPFSHND